MQAHALGEVDILGIVLLRVYSGTLLPIFIEIGSYLTDKEQKMCLHSFFETWCIIATVKTVTASFDTHPIIIVTPCTHDICSVAPWFFH